MNRLQIVFLVFLLVACGGEAPAPVESTPAPAPPPPAAPPTAELTVGDATVHLLPNGMGAGYLRVQAGEGADRLAGVATDIAHGTEIHESIDDNGMMRMEARPDGFEVPAGGELLLAQGGKHLMFHGLEVADDVNEVELTLQFAEAGEKKVLARVVRPGDDS